MSRFPMKFFASAFGSLVLVVAAGCEQRNDMATPAEPMASPASQEVNSLRPPPSNYAPGAGGAAAESDMDRMPVSGSDEADQLGEGKGGHGHGGHAGHAGKQGH